MLHISIFDYFLNEILIKRKKVRNTSAKSMVICYFSTLRNSLFIS